MTVSPVSVVDLFPGERAALLKLLARFNDDDWQRSTVCGGWTVHDLALHLLAVDCQQLSGLRDGFHGWPRDRPTADLSDWETLVAFVNDRNNVWVAATRRISPRLTQELLAFSGERLAPVWSAVDLLALGAPVSWAGPDPAPRWLHVAREYTERWTHQQHIRAATGNPGLTEPRWLHPVLDTLSRALPHTLRHTVAPVGAGVGLLISGPAGGAWWAIRQDDGWDLQNTPSPLTLTKVKLDQETAWRLFTSGLDPAAGAAHARISGDQTVGQTVLGMISIIA